MGDACGELCKNYSVTNTLLLLSHRAVDWCWFENATNKININNEIYDFHDVMFRLIQIDITHINYINIAVVDMTYVFM